MKWKILHGFENLISFSLQRKSGENQFTSLILCNVLFLWTTVLRGQNNVGCLTV